MYRKTHYALLSLGVTLAFLIAASSPGQTPTPAELLEKAIYTEETVGDLNEAIKLYEKVISEAEAAQTSAAQAQYRLARIYQKQGKQQEATEAFEKLIDEYPGEQELVAKAREQLPRQPELLPVPWGEGDVLQLNLKLATGLDAGMFLHAVEPAEHDGAEAWKCWTRGLVSLNGVQTLSTVLCERDGFAPITSYWQHSLLGAAKAVYEPDQVIITQLIDDTTRTIEIDGPVFDNEQGAQLFRRLPLAVGYQTTIPIVTSLGAGRMDLELEVPSKETLQVPAGEFECFKLVLKIGQTFWISDDEHRYLVRFQAGGVTADLTKVHPPLEGQPKEFEGEAFSLTLPGDWFTYAPEPASDQQKKSVYLLDPNAVGFAELTVGKTADLPEEHRDLPVAWTEAVLEKFKKALPNFELREGGIQTSEIGGRPAAHFIADFTEEGAQKVLYGVGVLGEEHAATFRVTAPADDFAEYREQLDKILSTFELK